MKRLTALLLTAMLILSMTACLARPAELTATPYATQPASTSAVQDGDPALSATPDAATATSTIVVEYDRDDLDASTGGAGTTHIALNGDSIALDGSGATVDGATITITSAGTYGIRGVLNDGQIVVDTEDEDTVVLVLNGADISCATSAPIYVAQAEKVVITLAEGTENTVTDGQTYGTTNSPTCK